MANQFKADCTKENLKSIRDFVKMVLKGSTLSDIEINQMMLAVDEICTNLIIHASNNLPISIIEINIQQTPNSILFEIVDKDKNKSLTENKQFDLAQYQKPNLQTIIKERKKGGIGLMLVQKIMDSVEILIENAQQTWRMVKLLQTQPY
jgi:serine/threonine-protein kinase RsbW